MVSVIEELDLSNVTLAGESIGATLALTSSVDLGQRVHRIVAFNTYDFADGLKRASRFAHLVAGSIEAPVVGPTVARLENRRVLRVSSAADSATPVICPPTTSLSSLASADAPDTQK
jgi:pimeloyl-ACP methyl ester carboxylesterase